MGIAVSVIMPVYNAAKFLRQSLDCVVNQTLRNIEIICVDDGSTDESLDILKEYSRKDERFRIIEQPNINAGAARNAGMDIACGKYLSFLDADDLFEAEMLECAYREAEAHSAEIVLFDADIFDSKSGNPLPSDWIVDKTVVPVGAVFSADDIREDVFTAVFHVAWNRLYCSKYIRERRIRFQEIEKHNDSFFAVMTLMHAARIRYIDSIFVHYRKGITNQISSSYLGKKEFYPALSAMLAIHNEIQSMREYDLMIQGFLNYSTQLLLTAFTAVSQKDYCRVFYLLKNTWLPGFTDEALNEDSFRSHDDYRLIKSVKENDATAHLFTIISVLNNKVLSLESIINNLDNKTWRFNVLGINQSDRVVIYGAGDVGKDYYQQITDNELCVIAAWVDKRFSDLQKQGYPVVAPDEIHKVDFDHVIISVFDNRAASLVYSVLVNDYHVPEKKIIWPFGSNLSSLPVSGSNGKNGVFTNQ